MGHPKATQAAICQPSSAGTPSDLEDSLERAVEHAGEGCSRRLRRGRRVVRSRGAGEPRRAEDVVAAEREEQKVLSKLSASQSEERMTRRWRWPSGSSGRLRRPAVRAP